MLQDLNYYEIVLHLPALKQGVIFYTYIIVCQQFHN